MADLPAGTVTFLFTDIDGSTRLLQQLGTQYASLLASHHGLLRAVFARFNGYEIDTQGDAFFVAFTRARDAVSATIEAQQTLHTHAWPGGVPLRVRMGLHTGEPLIQGRSYIGIDVHKAARIAAAGHGGQILISDTTCALVRDDLPAQASLRDLGEHRLKDLAAPVRLFQVMIPGLPDEFPPLKSLEAWPNNLPVQLSSFIGRQRDVAEVKRLLSTTRLLTLAGAGGSGKTRLSLQVAAEVLHDFPDGVWLVELAAISDPFATARAVATVLRLREQHDQPLLTTLTRFLELKRILLVLDNCEHLVASCAQLCAALLRAAPSLRILATSRESLGVDGEVVYRVPTLAVPPLELDISADRVLDYEATRLFVERAQAALPTFQVTQVNAPLIAEISRRLDGIPLAIEFAAARVKALRVEEIASRLHDRFRLLSTGHRTALPRHQTLRAALDWSYELLSDAEQRILRRLTVFAGGFTLEAAETVCVRNGVSEADVLDLMTHLVDKSLVMLEEGAIGSRYRLLETVREYATEKLAASEESDVLRRQHRDYFVALAERAEPELHGPQQVAWLDRLEAEHDNLRAALQWSLDTAADDGGLRLAGTLWWYWSARGYLVEGREWLGRVLETAPKSATNLYIKALTGAGALSSASDDYMPAVALLQKAVSLARQQGEKPALAVALALLGHATWHEGHPDAAVALVEESLALSRGLGDAWALARSSYDVAIVAWHVEDYERMAILSAEWLERSRATGDLWGIASALFFLGEAGIHRGDFAHASVLFRERLALAQQIRDRYALAVSQVRLAHTLTARGEVSQASALYRQSLEPLSRLGDRWWLAFCLEGLSVVATVQGQPGRAATLLGAADGLRATIGQRPAERPDYQRAATVARSVLGEEAFSEARTRGRTMTREQAIIFALGE